MYLQGGGSIRFAAGFVAGVLLREAAMRKAKRPPRSLLVPAGRDDANDGPMLLVRQLEADDVDKGFLELLGQLTSVGNVTREAFLARLAEIRAGPEHVYVVEENGRLIATGGMGSVYEAHQDEPRRVVALKLVRPGVTSPAARRRFRYEIELLARLRHPGIAQVYEAGTHDDVHGGTPYFAMEYVAGAAPITEHADTRGLPMRDRVADSSCASPRLVS